MRDDPATALEEPKPATGKPKPLAGLDGNLRAFSLWQRLQIHLISWVGTAAVGLIGRSLRFEYYGWENFEAAQKLGGPLIFTFWHEHIFTSTWVWRHRRIVVMSGLTFDSQYTARTIKRFGFDVARGSSSKGGKRALIEMIRRVRAGENAAFSIDGPRGPRYVAKPGSVFLSKSTGAAVLCFQIALEKRIVLRKSWDQTQIPLPFSRAAVFIAPPILVPAEASEEEQTVYQQKVQQTLDELHRRGEQWREDLLAKRSKSKKRN
jgi:lysophospholipid acyltransferase (LPLAT)-like uncharacterized protein